MSISEDEIIESLKKQISELDLPAELNEVGTTISVGDGVAHVWGLEDVGYHELVEFESGSYGVAVNLEAFSTGVMLINGEENVKQGDKVRRTGKFPQVPVGKSILGRVIDGLGRPVDDKGPILPEAYISYRAPAPGIIARERIKEPLYTGIKSIDALIPIGRGQRELIIGDRQTGKTALAIDAIINQRETHSSKSQEPVYCVYVAIGQKCSDIAYMVKKLEENGAMAYTAVVATTSSDSSALQFIAPYFGCAIGEYFRDRGMHCLIVYDDLSKHAVAYRQISLLLKRPPGREAYPGDIFFIHSLLLERAAKLSKKHGGGSMTALPIVETQAGDISAYIPTNVISITDGQIFLEGGLVKRGIRPAINLGLSVSRIGYAASPKAIKQVAAGLKLELAQYREAQAFAAFGSEVSDDLRRVLNSGARLTESLKQDQYNPMPMSEQVVTLYAHVKGYVSNIQPSEVKDFESGLIAHMRVKNKDLLASITRHQQLTETDSTALNLIIEQFIKGFLMNRSKG